MSNPTKTAIIESLKATFEEGRADFDLSNECGDPGIATELSTHLDRIAEAHASNHGDHHGSRPN